MEDALHTWRMYKAQILNNLARYAHDAVDGHVFELKMSIVEGVPLCQVLCDSRVLICGALT